MAPFFAIQDKPQVQTGGRRKHDSAPSFAHMYELEPFRLVAPLMALYVIAVSIRIEYLYK